MYTSLPKICTSVDSDNLDVVNTAMIVVKFSCNADDSRVRVNRESIKGSFLNVVFNFGVLTGVCIISMNLDNTCSCKKKSSNLKVSTRAKKRGNFIAEKLHESSPTRKFSDTEVLRGRRKVFDTETEIVRQGNCSTISSVVRLGFVGQLPCRTPSCILFFSKEVLNHRSSQHKSFPIRKFFNTQLFNREVLQQFLDK